MSLNHLYAQVGLPFPAGGRIAAHVDLREAGVEPEHTLSVGIAMREHKIGQPTNRGLDRVVGVAHLSGHIA